MSASPIPGMDPYLEPHWRDVRSRLVSYGADAVAAVLPSDLVARMEERVAIESEEDLRKLVAPDVRVFEPAVRGSVPAATSLMSGVGAVAEPVIPTAVVEPLTERFITVIEADAARLVTIVEFLSATNKRRGEGMRDYQAKRQQLLDAGVNVVEVDLVRQGDWQGLLMPFVAHPRHHTPYRAAVRLTSRLPCTRSRYDKSCPRYQFPCGRQTTRCPWTSSRSWTARTPTATTTRTTDYGRACDPPLEGEEAKWAAELLRSAARR